MPNLNVPRNIGVSPVNPGQPAWLEEIIQPLYHRESLATTVVARRYFQNPTAITPLDILPALSASGGQIPQPKLFVAHGIRVCFSENIATHADRFNDLVTLLWQTTFQFFLGERTYLWAPLFLVPAGGIGAKGYWDAAAADRAVAQSGGGGYFDRFSLQRIPITIPSRQLFYCEIAPSGTVTITTARPTFVVIDGAFGREL